MKAIQDAQPDASYRATQQGIARLVQNGLIYRERQSEYAYTAPRFGDFLRRKHPADELSA